MLLNTFWPQKTADILSYRDRQRAKEKYLHLPLGKGDARSSPCNWQEPITPIKQVRTVVLLSPQKQNNLLPYQENITITTGRTSSHFSRKTCIIRIYMKGVWVDWCILLTEWQCNCFILHAASNEKGLGPAQSKLYQWTSYFLWK